MSPPLYMKPAFVIAKTLAMLSILGLQGCAFPEGQDLQGLSDVSVAIFDSLTIPELRNRDYFSSPTVVGGFTTSCVGDKATTSLPDQDLAYKSWMVEFNSDGLSQYARLTVPDVEMKEQGYPFVLFLHGWVGKEAAPSYSIGCDPSSMYAELTGAFARAGFAVVSPGYRGHGTVNGLPAEGISYLEAFDQGAGLSTTFYAIDTLNLVAGLRSMQNLVINERNVSLDFSKFNLLGHSQGGDVGLIYLAVAGEGNHTDLVPGQSALWSSSFINRLDMLTDLHPMERSPEAFLAGDGSWTGSAEGRNGQINPNFVFAYPAEYIGHPDPANWQDWQHETWSTPTVEEAVRIQTRKMYDDLESYVGDMTALEYAIENNDDGTFTVHHDPRVELAFSKVGGLNFPQYITEPLTLHTTDRDFYSRPTWNEALCSQVNEQDGGTCSLFIYPGNTHGMRPSDQSWFSPENTPDGYPVMMKRFLAQFTGNDPASIPFQERP